MLKGQAFISYQKAKFLEDAIDKAERYLCTLKDIQSGVSEAIACNKYNVPKSSLRAFMFKHYNQTHEQKVQYDIYLKWQEKLFMKVMQCKMEEIPETAVESMNYSVQHDLSDRERDIIFKRYAEAKTLDEIGREYGFTRQAIQQSEMRAIRKMRRRKAI